LEEGSELRKVIAEQEARIRRLEAMLEGEKEGPTKRISLKEFVLSKEPDSDVQRVLTFGYYLEKYDGLEAFNYEDLKRAFRMAAESLPGNLRETVRKNVTKGHLMETGQKKGGSKTWMLTNTGEKVVDEGFTMHKKG
jgi:hypothetical protein